MKRLRLGFFVLGLAAAAAVTAGTAAADPTNAARSTPITVSCGTTTYHAVVNGNGAWTPAHDLNSNSILIPVAFGVETDVFTDPGGTMHTSTVPPRAKGSAAPSGAPLLNCSYHLAFSLPDGSSLAIDGTVVGFVTPASG